jgi:beta-glucosidase
MARRGGRRLLAVAVAMCGLATALPGASAQAMGRCGNHPWCDTSLSPDTRASLLLGALRTDEKIALLGGDDIRGVLGGDHQHTGTQDGVPRLDVPTVYYSDGPVGPRQGKSVGLPTPLALAATWSRPLARSYGTIAATEARDKGNDVIFAPTVNIARTPLAGRTFEGFGEDPFLVGSMAVPWIEGAQSTGVIANLKHFAVNNQEGAPASGTSPTPGAPLGVSGKGNRMLVDARVDERTLREIYLSQFEMAIKQANPGSVMCAYPKVNGTYACENRHLLIDILRNEWGYKGYVLADYGAAHNTEASFNNGLDFEPWPPIAYQPAPLTALVATGQAPIATLNEHVKRFLRTWFAFGLFDRPAFRDDDAQIDKASDGRNAAKIEEGAVTLLRNQKGALPLAAKKLRSIVVIGKPATTFVTGGGSGAVTPFTYTSLLDAVKARAGSKVSVTYNDGSDAAAAAAAAKSADAVLVVAGDYYTEGADRTCLSLECPEIYGDQDALIEKVAAANKHTIVVLETGGPALMPWRSQVAGIVEAWYAGGTGATGVARVLFGDVDPGGRLPITFPASMSQLPQAGDPDAYPGDVSVDYKEGVLVGYRWWDAKKLTPAFPFGFGLSYTGFHYGPPKVLKPARTGEVARVRLTIRNTGRRAGIAVPQLYVGMPQPRPGVVQPPWQLKGFTKFTVPRRGKATVTFPLDARAFSYWDTRTSSWQIAKGCYRIGIGSSSRAIRAQTVIARGGARCSGGGR